MDEPIEQFPDEVTIAFDELRLAILTLEEIRVVLERAKLFEPADRIEITIGRMIRWFSPLLRDLDDDEG